MKTILVQMADKRWTMQALHLAFALARNQQAQPVLLRLVQVRHLGYLGTGFGQMEWSSSERRDLQEFAATAEDYGVELVLRQMQCESPLDALVDAAGYLDAQAVFAQIPPSWVPYWQMFCRWHLEQRLALAQRQLYTLEASPVTSRAVVITVNPTRHGVGK